MQGEGNHGGYSSNLTALAAMQAPPPCPWIDKAGQAAPDEPSVEELTDSLAALEVLESDSSLWQTLQKWPWEKVQTAEAQWRARATEAVACARHNGTSLPCSFRPELLRPPWRADLPSHVQACYRRVCQADDRRETDAETMMEVLCTVECNENVCDLGLCWHCWHNAEAGGRPAEVWDLLGHMQEFSKASALGHRARLVERQWRPFGLLADAVQCTIQKRIAKERLVVTVLGGVGPSVVTAARSGVEVLWVETNSRLASLGRATVARNGVSQHVKTVEELSVENLKSLAAADILVLEGLESDGILGCRSLGWLQQISSAIQPGQAPQVLPCAMEFRAYLAETRLTEAAGLKFDFRQFSEAYGGLEPLPHALASHACGLQPSQRSDEVCACFLDLSAFLDGTVKDFRGSKELQLNITRSGRIDSVVVQCFGFLPIENAESQMDDKNWAESVYPLVAPIEVQAGDRIQILCCWNSHRLWFEALGTLPCVPPLSKVHLLDWYSEMMNDLPRNEAYAAAITSAVKKHRENDNNKTCRVVDIGCGAGLLSMLASQAGADEVIGVEITGHLALCANRVRAANQCIACKTGEHCDESVIHGDVRSISYGDEERFDIALTELLDSSGFGERLVPILRHTKSHMLKAGGAIIPRGVRVHAALADLRLPTIRGVDLACFEPFWLPARACEGEWMGMDLDDCGATWSLVSAPVEVFSVDFTADQRSIGMALCEHDVSFPLCTDGHASTTDGAASTNTIRCNAIVWWFDADVGEGSPPLCNGPVVLRPANAGATHWAQAVASLGPWLLDTQRWSAMRVSVRTDGTSFKWTPLGLETVTMDGDSLFPLPAPEESCFEHAFLQGWRQQASAPMEAVRELRNKLDNVGDMARLQALQSTVLHVAAQPGLFGLEATNDALTPFLKDFFV